MIVILWIFVGLLAAMYINLPIADPDLWWHITVGKWILANQTLPHVDYWNMFGAGQHWRAYSWLPEIILAYADAKFGIHGLLVLQIILTVLLSFSLMFCMSLLAKDWRVGALLGVYLTVSTFNHLTLRPQVLVWIYFAFLLAVSESIKLNGLSKGKILVLIGIGTLWANTHLSAALGLFAVGAWIFSNENLKLTAQAALAFFIGTLITPYFGGEWITFFSKTGHPFAFHAIAEFQPATIMQYSTVFIVLLIGVLISFLVVGKERFQIWQSLMVGTFILLGLSVVKFIPFSAIACGALIAVWWSRSVDLLSQGANREKTLGGLGEGLFRLTQAIRDCSPRILSGLAFVCFALVVSDIYNLWRNPLNTEVTPQLALDFIIEKKLPRPILNEFGAGGYIMYRLSDAKGELVDKVSIDGRTNVNPPEVWEEYQAAFLGKAKWHDYIEHVKPKTILWRQGSALSSLLKANPNWCQVFDGGEGENAQDIFVLKAEWAGLKATLPSTNCS